LKIIKILFAVSAFSAVKMNYDTTSQGGGNFDMQVKLITPEKLVLDERIDSVTVPGRFGQMTILPGHTMIVSELADGRLDYKKRDNEGKEIITQFTIGPGFLEVQKDSVLVLTSSVTQITQ
jgi:F-type H+-transporting ATPase subunit epsilon